MRSAIVTWWMSFADDDGFRGVIIVEATDQKTALARVNMLGINPGGEVLFTEFPFGETEDIKQFGVDRLVSKAELDAGGAGSIWIDESDGVEGITFIGEEHNAPAKRDERQTDDNDRKQH